MVSHHSHPRLQMSSKNKGIPSSSSAQTSHHHQGVGRQRGYISIMISIQVPLEDDVMIGSASEMLWLFWVPEVCILVLITCDLKLKITG